MVGQQYWVRLVPVVVAVVEIGKDDVMFVAFDKCWLVGWLVGWLEDDG